MEPEGADRALIIERLTAEIERSRTDYHEKSRTYHALIDEIPSGLPYPDGNFRLTEAGKRFRQALRNYTEAVRRLDEFVRTGRENGSRP